MNELIDSLIKTARKAASKKQKNCLSAVFFWRRWPRDFEKCDISSASERAYPGVFDEFWVVQIPPKEAF